MVYETSSELMERKVLELLNEKDGLTNKEIAEKLSSSGFRHEVILTILSQLEYKGYIRRGRVKDDAVRYYLNPVIDGIPVIISESAEYEQLILSVLDKELGMTDQEIREALGKRLTNNVYVYEICKQLAHKGVIKRIKKEGKPIVNILA